MKDDSSPADPRLRQALEDNVSLARELDKHKNALFYACTGLSLGSNAVEVLSAVRAALK